MGFPTGMLRNPSMISLGGSETGTPLLSSSPCHSSTFEAKKWNNPPT